MSAINSSTLFPSKHTSLSTKLELNIQKLLSHTLSITASQNNRTVHSPVVGPTQSSGLIRRQLRPDSTVHAIDPSQSSCQPHRHQQSSSNKLPQVYAEITSLPSPCHVTYYNCNTSWNLEHCLRSCSTSTGTAPLTQKENNNNIIIVIL